MAIRRIAFTALAFLLVAIAVSSVAASAQQSSTGSDLVVADSAQLSGRELLAAKKKPTKKKPTKKKPTKKKPTRKPTTVKGKKKPTTKTYTGSKCNKFKGCSLCTARACKTCRGTWMKTKLNNCVCKTGFHYNIGKTECLPNKKPTKKAPTKKKPTKKPSPRPTKKVVVKPPKNDGPALQPNAADPKATTPTALRTACKGGVAGRLNFTVLDKLHAFADAADACKAKGLKLPDIDAIFAGNSVSVPNTAEAAIQKCVGNSKMVWFDTSLSGKDCQAFMSVPQPTDAGVSTGRKLSAASSVLTTLSVPAGCSAKLPVLCV